MAEKYARELTVLPGACDSAGLLGIPDTVGLFMDIAARHAEALGCGIGALGPRGLFWLTVRTRVRFFRRPGMMEALTLETWPEPPSRLRANRDYLLRKGDEILAAGRTEWTVLDTGSGKPVAPGTVFPAGLDFARDTVWEEPFARLRDEPLEELGRYTVRSTDIDLGGHMNNAAYVRALAGQFSCRVWQAMDLRELEIAYRASCYEGETLIWQSRREEDGSLSLRGAKEDGQTAVLARLLPG